MQPPRRRTVVTGMTGGMDGNFKLASKFTLGEDGRLLALHAYINGAGGGLSRAQFSEETSAGVWCRSAPRQPRLHFSRNPTAGVR